MPLCKIDSAGDATGNRAAVVAFAAALCLASMLCIPSIAKADPPASPSAATGTPSVDSPAAPSAPPPAPASLSRPAAAESVVTLDDLMSVAMRESPLLHARDADRRAALERVPISGALPDPELSWEFWGAPLDDPAPSSASENRFQVSQRFPFPGKRGLERKEASARADVAGASLDTARLAVATALRKSF